MLTMDGSMGEGGGQVLRSSLALSMLTGEPMRIEKIRAGRKKPGLMRQHLTAVRAAAEICGAEVAGAEIGSRALEFAPGPVRAGEYAFQVGTAGSATLVFQTVLPALLRAGGVSKLTFGGGTHNAWAPPYDFLARALVPLLCRTGPHVCCELDRPGFYPAGGGQFRVTVTPAERTKPLELVERGRIVRESARALVARLPANVGLRERRTVQAKLGWRQDQCRVEQVANSAGPGNILLIEIASEHVTEVFTGFGSVGVPAEQVARKAVDKARAYLAAGAPVGEHLADQLLVPLLLCGGRFRTLGPTRHTRTNIEVIRRFLGVDVGCRQIERKVWEIEVPDACGE